MINDIINEKLNAGVDPSPPKSSYIHKWFPTLTKGVLVPDSIVSNNESEMPGLAENKENDVASLPLTLSKTVYSEDGKKRVIIMGDPVVQYLTSGKTLFPELDFAYLSHLRGHSMCTLGSIGAI